MDTPTKPKRWSVRKAAHLAEVAELTTQRDDAQTDAFNLRLQMAGLLERNAQLWRRGMVLAISATAGLVGTIAGAVW